VVAATALAAWLIWELTEAHPIVDLSLLKSRNFVLSTIPFALGFAVFFGVTVIQPTWLQTRMSYPAMVAGFVSTPAGVVSILMMPLITRVMSRFDARITATVSLASFAVTFNMRSGWSTDADFWTFALPSVVQGFAASTFFVSLVTLTLNGLRPAQIPAASGLSNFIRLTAASFAASITTTAYDSGAAMHQTRLAEAMGAHGEALAGAVTRMQAAGYGAGQALTAITEQVVRQAYTLSLLDIYRASAWVVLLAIPCVWFTSRAVGDSKVAVAD